ncbi:hypothetical protein JM946_04080 [Steroidobacter sp. S1-65]|uniref:Cell wall surface anchor family protein n=1 Tax=Steroidobacter gossypii TaxID=2805490 RepID=A0ABS1WSG7_9GAMM|nr:hypothetical protein [Steroidobacter gossypii]MBM0103904.1 hypothetical protein [Steroidobacter gossypii]
MKTRFVLIGVAMAAALNCAAVNAQGLGGVSGGLGGTLSGSMRDMSMATQGTVNGSFGADLDASSLRRTTGDTADRATNRVRDTTSAVRNRAAGKVGEARDKVGETRQAATTATSAAAATAVGAINGVQVEGAAEMAGSATSSASRDGINLAGATQATGSGALNGATLPQSEVPSVEPAQSGGGENTIVPSAPEPSGNEGTAQSSGALDVSAGANGSASASQSGLAATGEGSASASRK